MREYHLAIVGGGPRCTYAVERIAALLLKKGLPYKLKLSIFERTGQFGAGDVHSYSQPKSSLLNRTVGQITFSADESNLDESLLLDKNYRPTFYEWCSRRFQETGDEIFNLSPNDHPPRYLHGLALSDRFNCYITLLKSLDVEINLFPHTVVDIAYTENNLFEIIADGPEFQPFYVHEVLFVTGHSQNKTMRYQELEAQGKYIPYAYPLEKQLTYSVIPPETTVGIDGLGLTAIDIILYLTEGRGGTFVKSSKDGALENYQYVKSGNEPSKIAAFSQSGMFVFSRAINAKDEGEQKRQHKGVFFSEDAIQSLRQNLGVATVLPNGKKQKQLDFDKHVLPLVILEMAYVYYKTLLGDLFGKYLKAKVIDSYARFLQFGDNSSDSINILLKPVNECFDQAALFIKLSLSNNSLPMYLKKFSDMNVLSQFYHTLYGEIDSKTGLIKLSANTSSPWGHSLDIYDHRFCWEKIFNPLEPSMAKNVTDWNRCLAQFIEKDLKFSLQNNLSNPVKACCDGVWRDLRSLITKTVDNGGLLPESNKKFHLFYVRCHNRLSNGAGIEPMRKMLALIKAGILDLSIGPNPYISISSNKEIIITGAKTKVTCEASVLIEGKIHAFNPEQDVIPLYANLLKRKMIRKWCNLNQNGDSYIPGALDLDDSFHPIQADGHIEKKLTFIGPPTDGMLFLQQSAARPGNNSDVLNNIARWADQFYSNFKHAFVPLN